MTTEFSVWLIPTYAMASSSLLVSVWVWKIHRDNRQDQIRGTRYKDITERGFEILSLLGAGNVLTLGYHAIFSDSPPGAVERIRPSSIHYGEYGAYGDRTELVLYQNAPAEFEDYAEALYQLEKSGCVRVEDNAPRGSHYSLTRRGRIALEHGQSRRWYKPWKWTRSPF